MFRKLAPALVAPILFAAACASEADQGAVRVDTGAAAVAALRSAPEAAAEAGTGRFEMTIEVRSDELPGDTLEIRASGAFDNAAQQMAMELDLGAMFAAVGEAAPEGFDEPTSIVIDGDDAYLRSPILDQLSGTSGWLSINRQALGQDVDSLFGAGGADPSQMLEVLRGVSDDVEAVGREDVGGVATTRYTATIDLARALEEVPAEQRARFEAQLKAVTADMGDLPVEAWVDDDGLARRLRISLDEASGTVGVPFEGAMTIDFFDYGEPVDIHVPSPDEVTPLTDLMGGFADTFLEAGS